MESHILLKTSSRFKYFLYLEKPTNGRLLYSGHKLGISEEILKEILEYKYEVSTGRFYYLMYDIWLGKWGACEEGTNLIQDIWKSGMSGSTNVDLWDIWTDLLKFLTIKYGNFKNIWIIKNNI